jgi:RNA polymerase sigma-32 factor
MAPSNAVPASLRRYFADINRHPILTFEEEQALARAYRQSGDPSLAHRLVTANLRFVVKIAWSYRASGAKLTDLVQEGNLGLMKAVQRFDPDRGLRLVSYAVWSIRAYMQAFVLRTHSMVKLGTTRAQRRLFFSLGSATRAVDREAGRGDGRDAAATKVAERLGVTARDVEDMAFRLSARDVSLDAPLDPDGSASRMDVLACGAPLPDHGVETEQVTALARRHVADALARLSDRERHIVERRLLVEEPTTLTEIAAALGVSRERVRQIEARAKAKLRLHLEALAGQLDLPAAASAAAPTRPAPALLDSAA